MKQLYSAGVVVFTQENNEVKYLLLQHTAGHWSFPKGKMEGGETKQQAGLRELKEEAGIDADLLPGFEKQFTYQFYDQTRSLVKKTVYFFIGKACATDIVVSEEHQGFAWIPFNEAFTMITHDNARDVLCSAHQYIVQYYLQSKQEKE
jgi:bis(5'-nucleosidyl)-tetraphosphatase